MTKIRIVAAVVDTRRLTLYKEDGKTVIIPQGDPRLQRIIDESRDALVAGKVAEVLLTSPEVTTTSYSDFEEITGGLVRFFKVAKTKITGIFGHVSPEDQPAPAVEPVVLGSSTALNSAPNAMDKVLFDIMAHAVPATNDQISKHETVVAVVNNTPIPGVEGLHRQLTHANKMGSSKGVEAFLARIAKVISKRSHSVDDLLNFMSKGDLPIADDGSIIIYKILRQNRNEQLKGSYVDCHTGRVPQSLGSYVHMDEKMVDHNRRNECSQGLHVARRGYLGNFSGDVCVLAKVAPEDVIAVPEKDANKMRVCGYHILFELNAEMFSLLKSGRPMTSLPEAKKLLGRAISGDHSTPTENVLIRGSAGQDVQITPLVDPVMGAPTDELIPVSQPVTEVEAIDISEPEEVRAPAVDPKALSASVTQQKISNAKPKTQRERVEHMLSVIKDEANSIPLRLTTADDLVALRSGAKKSWNGLGHPELTDAILINMAQVISPGTKATKPRKAKAAPKAQPMGNARQDQFRMLFNQQRWAQLHKMKTMAKKGWDKLGFTPTEVAIIKENI